MGPQSLLSTLLASEISRISEYLGPLALRELYLCGDNKLNGKLLASTYYSNTDEFGTPVPWSSTLLSKLRQLKSVCISTNIFGIASASSHLTGRLMTNLPPSITSVELKSSRCFAVWNPDETPLSTEIVLFNFAEKFPNLSSLTLTIGETPVDARTFDDPSMRIEWLKYHLPVLPSTLTSLNIDHAPVDPAFMFSALPRNLVSLSIDVEWLSGFQLIQPFTKLQHLTLRMMRRWFISGEDFEWVESKDSPSLPLVTLEMPDFEEVVHDTLPPPDAIYHLFKRMSNLTSLSVPKADFEWDVLKKLSNLRSISLKSLPVPLENEGYPESLTSLSIAQFDCQPNPTEPGSWASMLPSSLIRLMLPSVVLDAASLSLLPPSTRELICRSVSAFKLFPAELSYLQIMGQICELECLFEALPPTTKIFKDAKNTFVRSQMMRSYSGAWGTTGWTNLNFSLSAGDFQGMADWIRASGPNSVYSWLRCRCEKDVSANKVGAENSSNLSSNGLPLDPKHAATQMEAQAYSKATHEDDPIYYNFDSLEWLQFRGLLSSPQRIGAISPEYMVPICFSERQREKRPELFDWALSHWKADGWPKFMLPLKEILNDGSIVMIDLLHSNGCPFKSFFQEGQECLSMALHNAQFRVCSRLIRFGCTISIENFLNFDPAKTKTEKDWEYLSMFTESVIRNDSGNPLQKELGEQMLKKWRGVNNDKDARWLAFLIEQFNLNPTQDLNGVCIYLSGSKSSNFVRFESTVHTRLLFTLLIERGADFQESRFKYGESLYTLPHIACFFNDLAFIDYLVTKGFDFRTKASDGRKPISRLSADNKAICKKKFKKKAKSPQLQLDRKKK